MLLWEKLILEQKLVRKVLWSGGENGVLVFGAVCGWIWSLSFLCSLLQFGPSSAVKNNLGGSCCRTPTIPCCAREKPSQKGLLVPFVMDKSPFFCSKSPVPSAAPGNKSYPRNSGIPVNPPEIPLPAPTPWQEKLDFFPPRSGVVRMWLTRRFSFLFLPFFPGLFWTRDPPGRNFPGKERPGWHQEAALRSPPQK